MFIVISLLYGLVVGSFLNVVVDRIQKGQSIMFPASHCPHCRHKLAWYDLIPLFSYLQLKGNCRYCQKHISYYYPLVELVTGLMFALVYIFSIHLGLVYMLYLFIVTSLLIVIFFSDLKYGIIPFPVVAIGAVTAIAYAFYAYSFPIALVYIFSGMGAFVCFLLLFLGTKGRGMGFGDVVFVILMGLFLGFPYIVMALYIAFLVGAGVSLILIATGNKKIHHDTIPFGPFLVIGTFAALFWGNSILQIIMPYFLGRV